MASKDQRKSDKTVDKRMNEWILVGLQHDSGGPSTLVLGDKTRDIMFEYIFFVTEKSALDKGKHFLVIQS